MNRRLLRCPSLVPPPFSDGAARTTWKMLSFVLTQICAVWRNDKGIVWWLCSPARQGVRGLVACTALQSVNWLLPECKTEAHKLCKGIEWYFYATNSKLSTYTDKHWLFISGFVTLYIPENPVHSSKAGNKLLQPTQSILSMDTLI